MKIKRKMFYTWANDPRFYNSGYSSDLHNSYMGYSVMWDVKLCFQWHLNHRKECQTECLKNEHNTESVIYHGEQLEAIPIILSLLEIKDKGKV